jgi:hypothetical protein
MAAQKYTLSINGEELGTLMLAVESTRNNYRDKVDAAPYLQERIERLEQVYEVLKRALELNVVKAGESGKPN